MAALVYPIFSENLHPKNDGFDAPITDKMERKTEHHMNLKNGGELIN
jgi:hypothetical protein